MTIDSIDIKQSCEYRWRMYHFKMAWIVLALAFLFAFIGASVTAKGNFEVVLLTMCIVVGMYLVCYLPFALYYLTKANSLVNNYKNYSLHQVELTNVKTSFWYRYSVYYTVTITVNGVQKEVNTNSIFSNAWFSPVKLDDYNNQKVWVLYDQEKDKAYVVGK